MSVSPATSAQINLTPIAFQAVWNENNRALNDTYCEKIKKVFFSAINSLVCGRILKLILPACYYPKDDVAKNAQFFLHAWRDSSPDYNWSLLKNHFTPSILEVTTPDGAKIHGTHFTHVLAKKDAPTVIFFQPNGATASSCLYHWMLREAALQELPYNFVYFDYRGCGESVQRPRSAQELTLDGDSMYQFVKDKLKVSPENIHFYGMSLGGGVSAEVKALHPECTGRSVNERSFSSLAKVATNFAARILNNSTLLTAAPRLFIPLFLNSSTLLTAAARPFIPLFLSLFNWNIDSEKALAKMKGKVLIVHHPKDEIMQKDAALHALFKDRVPPSHITELNLGNSPHDPCSFHCEGLKAFDTETFHPQEEISQFLFSCDRSFNARMLDLFDKASDAFQKNVFGILAQTLKIDMASGEDAFKNQNGQSSTEAQRVDAIVAAKHLPNGPVTQDFIAVLDRLQRLFFR